MTGKQAIDSQGSNPHGDDLSWPIMQAARGRIWMPWHAAVWAPAVLRNAHVLISCPVGGLCGPHVTNTRGV